MSSAAVEEISSQLSYPLLCICWTTDARTSPLHMLDNICSILCSIYVSKNIESHLISKAIAHCSHRSIYLPLKCQHQIIKSNHWSPSLSSFITLGITNCQSMSFHHCFRPSFKSSPISVHWELFSDETDPKKWEECNQKFSDISWIEPMLM